MKKVFVLLTMFVLLLTACEKELNNELSEIPTNHIVELVKSMNIQCTSTSSSDCSMQFEAKKGTLTCDCTESSMLLKMSNGEQGDFSMVSSYIGYFKKYLTRKYQLDAITVKSITYQLFDKAEVVSIKYILPSGKNGSVMYVTNLDVSKSNGGTVEVDCSGNCDSGSSYECTEVYSTVTGDISCSCAGCKMTVTRVD
jgi:hypothetical protein